MAGQLIKALQLFINRILCRKSMADLRFEVKDEAIVNFARNTEQLGKR